MAFQLLETSINPIRENMAFITYDAATVVSKKDKRQLVIKVVITCCY